MSRKTRIGKVIRSELVCVGLWKDSTKQMMRRLEVLDCGHHRLRHPSYGEFAVARCKECMRGVPPTPLELPDQEELRAEIEVRRASQQAIKVITRKRGRERFRQRHPGYQKRKDREYRLRNHEAVHARGREKYRRNPGKWKNRDKVKALAATRRSYAKHREKRLAEKREYFAKSKHRRYAYLKHRRSNDPAFALKCNLYTRMHHALRAQCTDKLGRFRDLVGCSPSELRQHIESQFIEGMSWDNRSAWHIDHIKPCAAFDLRDPQQQRECFHYSNLRPLWASDNIRRGLLFRDHGIYG